MVCIYDMDYLTISKPRGRGLVICIFCIVRSSLWFPQLDQISQSPWDCWSSTQHVARGKWRHDFQHYSSQSQMCLDSPVCHLYCMWTDWAPEKVSALRSASWHSRSQTLLHKWMCCFPREEFVGGLLWAVPQCLVLEHGLLLLTAQESWKVLTEITGPFEHFLWTCSTYGIMRFCS